MSIDNTFFRLTVFFEDRGAVRSILRMPGRPFLYDADVVTWHLIKTRAGNFLDALLIQSRGYVASRACGHCAQLHRQRVPLPFPVCKVLAGFAGNCCGNCAWLDVAQRCSHRLHRIPGATVSMAISIDDDDDNAEATASCAPAGASDVAVSVAPALISAQSVLQSPLADASGPGNNMNV